MITNITLMRINTATLMAPLIRRFQHRQKEYGQSKKNLKINKYHLALL